MQSVIATGVALLALHIGERPGAADALTSEGSPPTVPPKATLQSAFIDVYPDQLEWSSDQWGAEFALMDSVGVRQCIVAGAVRVGSDPRASPQGTAFYRTASIHPLLTNLRVYPAVLPNLLAGARGANALGANVTVVLGLIRAGYSALPADRLAIANVGAASMAVLAELGSLYAFDPLVRGVYLPQELANGVCAPGMPTDCTICCANCSCCFGPEAARTHLVAAYLGPLARQAKRLNPEWKVWTAPDAYLDRACPPLWPGCNTRCRAGAPARTGWGARGTDDRGQSTKQWCGTPTGTYTSPIEWAEWWRKTLADVPELDVIAHQDGVGNHNSLINVTAFFAALRDVVHAATPPRELWSDLEAFDIPAPPAPPEFPDIPEAVSPWWRIASQLAVEHALVDGFTTWEWHRYFSPLGGPQLPFPYSTPTPVVGTINSNASLHNFVELVRRRTQSGAVAPLRRASLHAHYDLDPVPVAAAGNLTDGLPHWNMGGPLPACQVRWAPGVPVTIRVTLPRETPVCTVRVFAARSSRAQIELPLSVTMRLGDLAGVYTLTQTTANNEATNVYWVLLPDNACVSATAVSVSILPQPNRAIAISEVEIYTS